MKSKVFKTSLLLFVVFGGMISFSFNEKIVFSELSILDSNLCYNVPTKEEAETRYANEPTYSLFLGKSFIGFKEALAYKESRGNYFIINKYGYLGKYQFGKTALSAIGIYEPKNFVSNALLQEKAFSVFMSRIKYRLENYIIRYEGKKIGGVIITESGILAAAHLGGVGNVKKFLRSNGTANFKDAFGTSVKFYLKKFSGYDTYGIIPDKKATVL